MTPWTTWLLGAWSALVLVTGVGAAIDLQPGPAPSELSSPRGRLLAAGATLGDETASAPTDLRVPAAPVAVEARGVTLLAPLVAVGKTPDGGLAVPDYGTAGWYQHSVVPGFPGAAVLAGHVDSTTGPDVFYALGQLREGDEVLVHHADGTASRFVVHGHEVVDKDELPVERIFDDPDRPELRLITCGGAFDRGARSYEDNVIVYAHLADRQEPAPG